VLKSRRSTIVTLTLALSACAPAPQPPRVALWSKPSASYDAFLRDRSTCIQTARATRSSTGVVSGGVGQPPPGAASSGEVINAQIFWPCMTARGWRYDPAGGYGPPSGGEVWVLTELDAAHPAFP
jgi:hypothetical protein